MIGSVQLSQELRQLRLEVGSCDEQAAMLRQAQHDLKSNKICGITWKWMQFLISELAENFCMNLRAGLKTIPIDIAKIKKLLHQ